jgi:hypothetical protein
MRLVHTLVGTFFCFPILPQQCLAYLHILPPPWLHLARPAPGRISPVPSMLGAHRCRPEWRSPALPLARVSAPCPGQRSPAPAPGGARPRRPLDGAHRRCPGGARPRRHLEEVTCAAPEELDGASLAWSLPAMASVRAPSPVQISSCPQLEWRSA